MEKLIEMVGENVKIMSGGESVDAVLRSANLEKNGHWTLDVAGREKGPSAHALVRGWMGHLAVIGAFGLRVPKDSTKCAICGKKIEGSDGRLKQHIDNYEAMRAVKWIDVTRPTGDHEKWAHPKCLHAVRFDKAQWPAGLVFQEAPESVDEKRQDEACKILKAKGHTGYEVLRMISWEKGKEPAIIGQLLDVEKLVPEVGDVVGAPIGNTAYVIDRVQYNNPRGYTCTGRAVGGSGACDLHGGYLRLCTLLVRNGKVVNKAYTL